jgi:hypothetical protein
MRIASTSRATEMLASLMGDPPEPAVVELEFITRAR